MNVKDLPIYTHIQILDKDGYYGGLYITQDLPTVPDYWTRDPITITGPYKAQYQNGSVDSDTGEFTGGTWVETGSAPAVDYAAIAEKEKEDLMASATVIMAPLQDAVEEEMATDEETALLKQWKKYRVLLSRVDVSAAPDITWPDRPA